MFVSFWQRRELLPSCVIFEWCGGCAPEISIFILDCRNIPTDLVATVRRVARHRPAILRRLAHAILVDGADVPFASLGSAGSAREVWAHHAVLTPELAARDSAHAALVGYLLAHVSMIPD